MHLNATSERQVIPLNSEEDLATTIICSLSALNTLFLNVILPLAYSKLYRESDPN